MNQENLNFALWLIAALVTAGAASIYTIRIENQYRQEFELEPVDLKASLPSLVMMLGVIVMIAWESQSRLTAIALPAIGLAGASLRGIWRIDRQCLLIPDRLQALGCAAGLYYLGALIATGEPWRDQCLELGFAFALVALMWALSAVYLRMRGAVGFGFGDIKLLGWLSFFVGKRMIDLILYSIMIGLVYLLVSTAVKSIKAKKIMLPGSQDAFAFGPAIVLAVIAEALLHYA